MFQATQIDQARTSAATQAPACNHRAEAILSRISPWVYVVAATATLLHFLFNSRYGFFRDELYYAACGERLAWGYVDHAPLIAVVSHVTRAVLGDSLFALRFFPALAGAAKVFLGGWIARENRRRQVCAVFVCRNAKFSLRESWPHLKYLD